MNTISVDKTVVPKSTALIAGSILEICGTRFRWKFGNSQLVRSGMAKKMERTPTSSMFGDRLRTTLAWKKQSAAVAAATGEGSGKKLVIKKAAQQDTPNYTLLNIIKRFTVHKQNSEDGSDEENMYCEDCCIVLVR